MYVRRPMQYVGLHFYFKGDYDMEDKKSIIHLEKLGKEFKTSNGPIKALDDITLDIMEGEFTN